MQETKDELGEHKQRLQQMRGAREIEDNAKMLAIQLKTMFAALAPDRNTITARPPHAQSSASKEKKNS